METSSSSALPGSNAGSQNKKRRKRYALSCSACKERKIKCDRNVPNCSSCVARGIQMKCRWGDERDQDVSNKPSKPVKSVSIDNSNGTEVDDVVEKVLKRLKSKDSVQDILSPSVMDGPAEVSSAVKGGLASLKAAHLIETTAFDGVKLPPGGDAKMNLRCMFQNHTIQPELVRQSLLGLPPRDSVDILVEHYMAECEPSRNLFNSVILFQQLDDFWNGVAELEAASGKMQWSNVQEQPILNAMPRPSPQVLGPTYAEGKTPYLCSILRQGLISVVFGLLALTIGTLTYDTICQMKVLPADLTEEEVDTWKRQYENLSIMHLNLADYLEQPTIWAIQALRLHLSFSMDLKRINTSSVHSTMTLRLCICLGLNRLGSAVEDVQRIRENKSKQVDPFMAKESEDNKLHNVTAPSYGVSISNFEENNLAYRELGRKLWNNVVSTDWLFGSHIDSIFFVTDNINQTDPPCSLQDAELLSEAAPALLCRREMNDIVSENAFPRCFLAIAKAGRLAVQLENAYGSPLDYHHVLRVDAAFQGALQQFPWFLSFTQLQAEQRQKSKLLPTFSKPINLQRIILHDQIQFRLLRVHRLYLGQGFKDEKYRYSLQVCLDAAHVIIDAKVELSRLRTKSKSIVPLQIHLLQAALVLHLLLIFELEHQQHGTFHQRRQRGEYILEDFDGTLKQLQLAMKFLREDTHKLMWLGKGLSKLEAFVQMLKDRNSNTIPKSPSPSQSAAADILASIPSATMSLATPSSNDTSSTVPTYQDPSTIFSSTPSSSTATATAGPALGTSINNAQYEFASSVGPAAGSATYWNQDATLDPYYNADMWSLEALFPNSDTYPVDLVDALEKIVWAQ